MPKEKKPFTYEVKDWMGVVKESKNSNWTKYVYKVAYNDKPAGVDIRNVQFKEDGSVVFHKGISLTDEECDNVVDILISNGYGTTTAIEKELDKRNQVFGNEVFDTPLVVKLGGK